MLPNKPSYVSKTKRQQLEEKRMEKFGIPPKGTKKRMAQPIVLDSEDDIVQKGDNQALKGSTEINEDKKEHHSESQKNYELEKTQKVATPKLVNKFDYARLTKKAPVTISIDVDSFKMRDNSLEVILDQGVIGDRDRDSLKAYTFYVEGSKQESNVKKITLKDRAAMQVISQARQVMERNKLQQVKQVVQVVKVDKDEEDDEKEDKKNRYFQISHELCYRCGKQGHYAMNCLEQWSRKCKNCFSRQHDEHNCPQTCYQCGNVGHISSDCPESRDKKCQRCKKRGHAIDYCGVILGDKNPMNNFQEIFNDSDIKKMKCIVEDKHTENSKKSHHFNCFELKQVSFPFQELRIGKKEPRRIDLRNYQIDDMRRAGGGSRRNNDSRQHGNYGRDRARDYYRGRYNEDERNDRYDGRSRGQNRSFSHRNDDRSQGYRGEERSFTKHNVYSKSLGHRSYYF